MLPFSASVNPTSCPPLSRGSWGGGLGTDEMAPLKSKALVPCPGQVKPARPLECCQMVAVPTCKAFLGQSHTPHIPTYPHPDDVDLHEQQHAVQDHQKPREAEAQLREADGMVIELDELDGLSDEGQDPIDKQSCREGRNRGS